jgi:methionyl-tRNA formyltransferase
MLNDEKEVGVSIHEMDESLDNGAILVQKKVLIHEKDSLHSLYLKTIEVGVEAMLEAIEKLDNNFCKRIFNDSNKATYFNFPKKEHGKLFRKKGKKFF